PAQLQGVLLTHEHTDHILGLPTLVKRGATPVIGDPRTLGAVEQIFASGYLSLEDVDDNAACRLLPSSQSLDAGSRRIIGDIEVISFPVSHDAVAPCGY